MLVVRWDPALNGEGVREGVRRYRVYGKENLTDEAWREVSEGEEPQFLFFRIAVDKYVRAGGTFVAFTETGRNRLIGDHLEPDDCLWHETGNAGRGIRCLPDFVFGQGARPSSNRVVFTVWDYFGVNTPLLPSGLLGPARVEIE